MINLHSLMHLNCLLLVTVTTRRRQLTIRVLTPTTGRLLPIALITRTACSRVLLRLIRRIETTVRTGFLSVALEILAPLPLTFQQKQRLY